MGETRQSGAGGGLMAESVVAVTGLDELRRAVDQLPRELENELRAIAFRVSRDAKERARALLLGQIRGHNTKGHQHTADSIVINDRPDEHLFEVTVENPSMPNLGLWLERGTVHMAARPFMRPAGDAVTAGYQRDSLAAAEKILGKLDGL